MGRDACRGDVRSESGVSLIEVIVAFSILGVVVAGLVATTINTLNLSRSNANRVVAANLAAGEIQRIQALDFDQVELLADAAEVTTPEVDGLRFTVTSDARWVSNDGMVGACTAVADAGAENILRVDVEVSWEPQRFATPVRTQTSIAPPFEAYAGDGGSLAVFVSDDAIPPNPLPAAQILIRSVATGGLVAIPAPDPDDDSGCLVVSGLIPGDYEVEVSLVGYIDAQDGGSPSVQVGGVRAGFRTNLEFFLSTYGQLGATVAGRNGTDGQPGATPVDLPRFAVPSDEPSTEPRPLPIDGTRVNVPVGDHELWAGFCLDADPGPGLRNEASVAFGAPVDGVAAIETVEVRWAPGAAPDAAPGGGGGGGPALTLFAEHVGDCGEVPPGVDAEGDFRRINLGQMPRSQDGVRVVAVPFGGPWRITAERTTGQGQVIGRAVDGDVVFDPQATDTPVVLLGRPACEVVGTPSWVASASQALPLTAVPNQVAVTVTPSSGNLLAGDLLVVDVASEATDAAEWAPTSGVWTRYPGGSAADGGSTVTWVQALAAGAPSATVAVARPPDGDGGFRRGAVHVNVYRGAEPIASSHPVGGVGQLQQNRINLPGVQLRPGGLVHTTVLLEGTLPSGVTLVDGIAGGGPSSFQAQSTDVNPVPPDLLFHTFRTIDTANTNNQRLQWNGEADAREIRRLRFMGVCP